MSLTLSCPECNGTETGVVDSRSHQGLFVRRRRVCQQCGHRFTTFEVLAESAAIVKRMLETHAKMVPMADVDRAIKSVLKQLKALT